MVSKRCRQRSLLGSILMSKIVFWLKKGSQKTFIWCQNGFKIRPTSSKKDPRKQFCFQLRFGIDFAFKNDLEKPQNLLFFLRKTDVLHISAVSVFDTFWWSKKMLNQLPNHPQSHSKMASQIRSRNDVAKNHCWDRFCFKKRSTIETRAFLNRLNILFGAPLWAEMEPVWARMVPERAKMA